ncbi:Wzz/FepE/Etk N-terminal domain-containing protein [Algoriphagus pacificus]|uniref:Polysaccharide chain length determinant N-terminal domain-containing protein n=1 Tax=Algoriphagus pacificus TaxID=2811234 RepID=A0ABS3CKI6_9BACT|nr:Wzz/FepE/Etk N-terminal domain-containing protein [Algoriphagus pacificus]MBN7817582.1 hypothetical protein [Algoriphagus pacificus]
MANEPIDLADLIKYFIKQKMLFLKSILLFIALGLLIILLTRNHYQSTIKFIAQSNSSSGASGLMKQLGGLSGLNLGGLSGGAEDGLSPSIYQEVIYSYPFLWKLSKEEIQLSTDPGNKVKVGAFVETYRRPSLSSLIKKYTIRLPSTLSGSNEVELDFVNEMQDSSIFVKRELVPVFNEFKKILTLESDPNSGAISLVVESVDPEASAQIAAEVFQLLSQFVIKNKTEKAEQNLEFVQKQYDEAKKNFYDTQSELASFRDRNQNLSFSTGRAAEERLVAEFNIASNLYTNLAVQLDQAKIKVQEDIPVLTVINPPVVSYQTSKPNIPLILAICVFLGFVSGFVWALVNYLKIYLS